MPQGREPWDIQAEAIRDFVLNFVVLAVWKFRWLFFVRLMRMRFLSQYSSTLLGGDSGKGRPALLYLGTPAAWAGGLLGIGIVV